MAKQRFTARTGATEIFVAARRPEVEAAEGRGAQLEVTAKPAADNPSRARSEMEAREKEISPWEERVQAQEAGSTFRGCEFAAREEAVVAREEARRAVAVSATTEAGFLDCGEHLVEPMPDEEF